MSKFNSYLIVSDLDGTFFGENASVLQNNVDAIRYFKENGGKFTFATGRDYKILSHQFPKILTLPNCPGILCNGVYLYDFVENKPFYQKEIDKKELLDVIEHVKKEVPEATFRISYPDGFLCSIENPLPFPENKHSFFSPIVTWDKLENHLDKAWYKLVYCYVKENSSEENWIGKVKFAAEKVSLENIVFIPSADHLLEFLPKGSGKGSAVNFLRELYPERKIICVGDYDNDLDMLKACDIPACPENAPVHIQNVCTTHLCHHQNGCIADLIYKLDSSTNK